MFVLLCQASETAAQMKQPPLNYTKKITRCQKKEEEISLKNHYIKNKQQEPYKKLLLFDEFELFRVYLFSSRFSMMTSEYAHVVSPDPIGPWLNTIHPSERCLFKISILSISLPSAQPVFTIIAFCFLAI